VSVIVSVLVSQAAGVTDGTLLGGRVRYRQFAAGHRSGFEPVLLAAAVAAKPGQRVLEAGTGAGAALLCLAHRLPGVIGTGLEIDAALAELANENFRLNGFDTVLAMHADATAPPAGIYDHVLSNPPWHDQAGTHSPDAARALAHHAPENLLTGWIAALTPRLASGGSFTLILPGAALPEAITALSEKYGALTLFPLWPRAGQAAKQFILTARKGARTPAKILPGLTLHDADGITTEAELVLRDGGRIDI
jgi:tRNA1Val (adenine37-N6)-methyltransferase